MRRSVFGVVAGVIGAAVVTAVVVTVVRANSDGNDAAPTCALATAPAGSPPVLTASSTATAGLTVAEQGFSPAPERKPYLSVGALLRNTTDRVAWRTRVFIDATGASGPSLVFAPQPRYQILEVPMILPGAAVSVGFTLAIKPENVGKVTKVSLTPVVTGWLPAGDGADGLAPITTKIENATRDEVRFTAATANCADLVMRGVGVVWRDTTGKIVGGGFDGHYDDRMCKAGGSGSAGAASALLDGTMVPAAADLAKVELSPYCDLAKGNVVTPDGPFND
ncbi:hypothetical protein AB0M54_37865 [Actinoplanes sp. NPDC051470]|uniref:hypothetical protein n=1 Tax=Actinoplanes sp. NPDC051470 TaxID=3157224 RepID=UPI003419B078